MIKHKSEYLAYIQACGVGSKDQVASSPNSYVSYLHSVSEIIGQDITPESLRSEIDISKIAAKLDGKRAPKTLRNYCSAMRQYIAFVQERQGSGWCDLNPDGILVLMAHQNFFHRNELKAWYYEGVGDPRLPHVSASAARSIRMMSEYFRPGREILLPVGVFDTDGQVRADGTHEPAEFLHATGAVYRATMRSFDPGTGTIVCDVVSKFTV